MRCAREKPLCQSKQLYSGLFVYASCLKLVNGSSLTFSSGCKSTQIVSPLARIVSHVVFWRVVLSLRVKLNISFILDIDIFASSSGLAKLFGHKPFFMKIGINYGNKCSFLASPTCYVTAVRFRYFWGDSEKCIQNI